VVESLEQRGLGLEAVVAVIRLVPLTDLIRQLPHPPVIGAIQRARPLDLLAHVIRDALARVISRLGVEHQDQFVVPVHSDARL
jgi:hypothetical protein